MKPMRSYLQSLLSQREEAEPDVSTTGQIITDVRILQEEYYSQFTFVTTILQIFFFCLTGLEDFLPSW
jgi:hypothetical protein